MCKMPLQLKYGVACSPPLVHIYIQTWKLHISGITYFPFFMARVEQNRRRCVEPCQMAEVFVGLGTFKDRKKRGLKKIKEAP